MLLLAAPWLLAQLPSSSDPPTFQPTTVLGAGMATPDGLSITGAHEPSLLFIPPEASGGNGTLLAVSGGDPPKQAKEPVRAPPLPPPPLPPPRI